MPSTRGYPTYIEIIMQLHTGKVLNVCGDYWTTSELTSSASSLGAFPWNGIIRGSFRDPLNAVRTRMLWLPNRIWWSLPFPSSRSRSLLSLSVEGGVVRWICSAMVWSYPKIGYWFELQLRDHAKIPLQNNDRPGYLPTISPHPHVFN